MKKRVSLLFLMCQSVLLQAQLQVAELFTNNMVLQRDQPIYLWGRAEMEEQVTISFIGKDYSVETDGAGKWKVKIPAIEAGGPYEMSITCKADSIWLTNILIGDVWLCGGQSNMEWEMARFPSTKIDIEEADDTMIRHFKVPLTWSVFPEQHLDSSAWAVNDPKNTGSFTALGYYFAKELRKQIDVPIGLLNSTWGGSRIEPWMSAEALKKYVEGDAVSLVRLNKKKRLDEIREIESRIYPLADSAEIEQAHRVDFDASGWKTMELPGLWEHAGYPGMNGVAYLRRIITLSAEEAASGITLRLGKIDDSDHTWVNGNPVGQTSQWDAYRTYKAGPEVLHEGRNVILIRVEDVLYGGGLYGEPDRLYYRSVKGNITLTGDWQFRVHQVTELTGSGISENKTLMILYNKMIHPLHDFPIKGIIWYQGTSNATGMEDAYQYRELFTSLINDWRERWVSRGVPFLWAQLANFTAEDKVPMEGTWSVLRESQTAALSLPKTAQVVVIDIGEADNIHPDNKQEVGYRLSLAARKMAYNEDLVYSGPLYKSMIREGQSLLLDFDHKGSGLMTTDKYGFLKGFTICGKDGVFQWAWAKIESDRVRVWSDKVINPQHVRYAWATNPGEVNLYNREGLPACPFRTDE